MWTVRAKTVPVTFGALGTVKKGLDQKIHCHRSATELQEETVMSTANSIRRGLG